MKARFALVFLALIIAWFEFFSNPARAQTPAPEPTPTLIPALSEPVSDTEHLTLSLQIEQAAEFALFAYYQGRDNAVALADLAYMQTMTDPVVVTDTLPSGNQWQIRREFTYGDITAGIALIAILLLQLVRFIWDVSRPQTEE